MESTVNKLIKMKNDFRLLSESKIYSQKAKDEAKDKLEALDETIKVLADLFELKLCESCDQAFEKCRELDTICAACSEHNANRYASDMADLEWHRRVY